MKKHCKHCGVVTLSYSGFCWKCAFNPTVVYVKRECNCGCTK